MTLPELIERLERIRENLDPDLVDYDVELEEIKDYYAPTDIDHENTRCGIISIY